MFHLFKKKPLEGSQVTFKIDGMHCISCSMNIDGELEDTKGVIKAETSYAKAKTMIIYDPSKIGLKKMKQVIESLKYTATEVK